MAPITEADILSEVVLPDQPSLAAASAEALLEFKFGAPAVERMNQLAEINRQGALDAQQRQELENYQRVGRLLNLLHAKARLVLHRQRGI